MSIPILEACRKRKRKPKLFNFRTFSDPGCPINPVGPFRDNIRLFLQECAEPEEHSVQGMPTWCTLLVHENGSFVVPLYTIEENVQNSPRPFCNQCRCTGWSNHFVSKRKYHFIITEDEEWNKPLGENVFDVQSHLLHGLIHCNGFGHLLCINGIEGGSKFLFGREIMDLWDRICNCLHTRKISVEDLSKKRSMDLRLLHGVAYGHPWYGRWGYRFCHGSFGVGDHHYSRALEVLSSLDLNKITQDFVDTNRGIEIKNLIRYYRDMSETQLFTMKDLLKFILTIKSQGLVQKKPVANSSASSSLTKPSTRTSLQNKNLVKEKSFKYKKFTSVVANMDSRWPRRRLEYAAEIIVSALKENKADKFSHCGMTRQDVRDAARLHIGDTGLLDYVLKSLNNVIVGSHIIRRAVNPRTRILEYTIHELENGIKCSEQEFKKLNSEPILENALVPGADMYNDVLYLYNNVLLDYPGSELVELATQGVLDSKHFAKEWPFKDEEGHFLTFICKLKPTFNDVLPEHKRDWPPGEIIIVPLYATLGELKKAAEEALRDTYTITKHFVVTEIEGMEEIEDGEIVFGAVESGVELFVRGNGIEYETPLKYQGGVDNWKVRCECGARDDDGERMVACDICEVWQHTRCCGIEDSENVPPLFVCSGCCGSLVPSRIEPSLGAESFYGDEMY